jgi:hypothetical protein
MAPVTVRLRLYDSCSHFEFGAIGYPLEAKEIPRTVILFASSTPLSARTIHDSLFVDDILFPPMAEAVTQAMTSARLSR